MRRNLSLPLLCLLLATPLSAGRGESSYSIGAVLGYDSNPMKVMSGGPAEPGGLYSQLQLRGGATYFVGEDSNSAFFINGSAATRFDGSETEGAERDSGSLRAGVAVSPAFAGHRLVLSTGGRFSLYRGTFIDPATGRVYEANVDPPPPSPATTPIPERLDHDSHGAFLNLRFKQNPRWTYYLNTSIDRTDYVEDYQAETSLDPLDYESVTLRPGVDVRLSDVATLGLYASFTDLDYEARPALDEGGDPVPGTVRRYEYAQYGVTVKIQPVGPWSLDVGLAGGGRDDLYAGYYDSANGSGFLAVAREIGERNQLRLYSSLRDVDFDSATVTGDPTDPIRSSQERRYAARFQRRLGEALHMYVESGVQRTDSRDPVFGYDRDWVLTGFHYGR